MDKDQNAKVMEYRITLRCSKEPENHAKQICIAHEKGLHYAATLAELLDGTSDLFIHKPTVTEHDRSPIGRCVVCGGELSAIVSEHDITNVRRSAAGKRY